MPIGKYFDLLVQDHKQTKDKQTVNPLYLLQEGKGSLKLRVLIILEVNIITDSMDSKRIIKYYEQLC